MSTPRILNIKEFVKENLEQQDNNQILIISTFDYLERIIDESFTANWRLNYDRAKKCTHVVVISKSNYKKIVYSKIIGIIPSPYKKNRYQIHFSKCTPLKVKTSGIKLKFGEQPIGYLN